jgi:hypothetical protein
MALEPPQPGNPQRAGSDTEVDSGQTEALCQHRERLRLRTLVAEALGITFEAVDRDVHRVGAGPGERGERI